MIVPLSKLYGNLCLPFLLVIPCALPLHTGTGLLIGEMVSIKDLIIHRGTRHYSFSHSLMRCVPVSCPGLIHYAMNQVNVLLALCATQDHHSVILSSRENECKAGCDYQTSQPHNLGKLVTISPWNTTISFAPVYYSISSISLKARSDAPSLASVTAFESSIECRVVRKSLEDRRMRDSHVYSARLNPRSSHEKLLTRRFNAKSSKLLKY